jgi:hypothetical protein
MTPTIQEIKAQILAAKSEQESLAGLDSTSNVAIYNLWAYVVASVAWALYSFLDLFQVEMNAQIANQKVGTTKWYQQKALGYLHGVPLIAESDRFDTSGYNDLQLAQAKIVGRAAVNELELGNRKSLFIKVAKESGGNLQALTAQERNGVEQYFARIKFAGTKLFIFSDKADDLRLEIDFYYNSLIYTDSGVKIDGTNNEPVQDTIRDYLRNLRFNGEFTVAELEKRLRVLEGAADQEVYVMRAAANYENPPNYIAIDSSYIANSGYMQITDDNLTINFIPKNVAL